MFNDKIAIQWLLNSHEWLLSIIHVMSIERFSRDNEYFIIQWPWSTLSYNQELIIQ